jgi:hypothetical protein
MAAAHQNNNQSSIHSTVEFLGIAKSCSQSAEDIDALYDLIGNVIQLLKLMKSSNNPPDEEAALSESLKKVLRLQHSLGKSKEYFTSGSSSSFTNADSYKCLCF